MHPPGPHDEQSDHDGGHQVGGEEGGGVEHLLHPADPVHHDQAPAPEQHLGVLVRLRPVQVIFKFNSKQKIVECLLAARDPTECGSYLGALVCDGGIVGNCGGKLLHSNPLQTEAPWKCQGCGKVI